ncbi:unnamed protein product [Mytilus coruscus]|uniref:Peptidase A2 domain-containing protein n=1 Tax=Mytilus coruscus TaxID=42192 RepID=A0A6J8AIT1_MYTCO|nr:unnamed protein product [Mytilus coruscus]
MDKRDSSDREIYFGGARPKVSMDTGIGLSSTVLSASTPRMIETQKEIQRLTKEYETLQDEISSAPTPKRSSIPSVFQPYGNQGSHSHKHMGSEKPVVRPSKYDGSVSWEDYKIQFEMISELNYWTDNQKAMFLATSLNGNAQSVLADIDPIKRKDYKSICEALASRFGTENRTELFRVQLKNIRKRKDQELPELAQHIKRLSRKAYPKAQLELQEMLSRDHFIDALDDADTRLRIHQAHPKTLDDAVKLAVELEAFYIADKQRDKPSSVRNFALSESSEVSGQIKTLSDVVEELRRELQFLKRDMSQQRRGFNNNNKKTGKRGCWSCVETSHIRRNCPDDDKSNRNYQQKDRVRTGRVASGDGGMYIPGKFQGTNVQCLVDTGANVTILNDKIYDSLSDGNKVVLRPTHTNMKLADGKPLKVRGIGKMNVEIGRTLLTHDLWVADIDEDIDCIIGFDFMKQNMCCIDVAKNTMTVNKEEISCAVVNTQGVRCCRVAVSETTVIPPGVEQIIPGKVIDIGYAPDCSMLVASDKFVEKHQLLLAKTVVNSSSNVVPIQVLNTTDKSAKVYEKTTETPCEAVTVLNESACSLASSKKNTPEHLSSLSCLYTNSISDLVYRIQNSEPAKSRVVHYKRSGLKPYYRDFDNWLIKTVIQKDTESNAITIEENNTESDIELSENEQCDLSNFPTENVEYSRVQRVVKRPPNRFVPD